MLTNNAGDVIPCGQFWTKQNVLRVHGVKRFRHLLYGRDNRRTCTIWLQQRGRCNVSEGAKPLNPV